MKKQTIKSIIITLLSLAVFLTVTISYTCYRTFKEYPEMKNLEFNYLISRCSYIDGACSSFEDEDNFDSDNLTMTFEPVEWKVNYATSTWDCMKEISLDGYSHVHSANRINGGEMVYTAKANNGKYYIVKRNNDSSFERFEINELPLYVNAYNDTILLTFPSSNNSAKIFKADFRNQKIISVIDDLEYIHYAESSSYYLKIPGKIWTRGSKILYQSVSGKWKLHDGNATKELDIDFDGICVGFNRDNSVVFYKDTVRVFLPFTDHVFYSWGKFTEYDLEKESKAVLSRIISEDYSLKNFYTTSDGKYVIMQATNLKNPTIISVVNIEKGRRQKLGHIWSPGLYSTFQPLD